MRVIPELRERASDYPDKKVLFKEDREATFGEVLDSVNRLSGFFRAAGVEPGDRVALWLPNCIEFVYAYFAALQSGAVCVPLDIRLGKEGLLNVMKEVQARVLITATSLLKNVEDQVGNDCTVLTVDPPAGVGARHLAEVMAHREPDDTIAPRDEGDDALILYTSGTAGRSKGVVLTYKHMGLFPEAMGAYIKTSADDSFLCVLPMSHISGPILCNCLAAQGMGLVIVGSMNPKEILDAAESHRPTVFHAVATIFNFLLKFPRFSSYDLSSLRVVAMMGEPVPLWLMRKYQEKLPNAKILQGYGLTETSPLVTLVPIGDADAKIGSIGRPVPGCKVAIMDKEGKLQPPKVVGEIVVRGPHVMKGYYLNPEKTSEVIRDGWFHTGDLGWKDEDDFFYHAGRADEVIITGGLLVYPPEVEQVLAQHPDVLEVLVDGPSDPKRGQFVRAQVVLKQGSSLDPRGLLAFARSRLESYKAPRKIELVDSIEKSSTGKIQRKRNSGSS